MISAKEACIAGFQYGAFKNLAILTAEKAKDGPDFMRPQYRKWARHYGKEARRAFCTLHKLGLANPTPFSQGKS